MYYLCAWKNVTFVLVFFIRLDFKVLEKPAIVRFSASFFCPRATFKRLIF